MLFMSPQHVETMNELLAASEEVKEAAAALDRDYVILYELSNGRAGVTEYWSLSFAGGEVRFGLEAVADPDVKLVGDWYRMVTASRLGREGEHVDPGVAVAFEAAGRVATVPVDWPDPV